RWLSTLSGTKPTPASAAPAFASANEVPSTWEYGSYSETTTVFERPSACASDSGKPAARAALTTVRSTTVWGFGLARTCFGFAFVAVLCVCGGVAGFSRGLPAPAPDRGGRVTAGRAAAPPPP